MRVVFNQHDITHVRTAADAAFQQVVAEHGFISKAVVQHSMQCLDVEQTFAGKGAHAEEVLVHIRRAVAVRINAALACKHGMKRRAFLKLRQRRDDPRLQNAVTPRHTPADRVDVRCVQWVRCNGDQLAQSRGRQAGVAVEGHDVLNAAGQVHAVGKIKRVVPGCVIFVSCGNQTYQCFELAALALPAYPFTFGAAPFAPPVNDQKARRLAFVRWVGRVQHGHLRQRLFQHGVVSWRAGLVGICPVRQQCELGVRLQAGQPVQVKPLGQSLN